MKIQRSLLGPALINGALCFVIGFGLVMLGARGFSMRRPRPVQDSPEWSDPERTATREESK